MMIDLSTSFPGRAEAEASTASVPRRLLLGLAATLAIAAAAHVALPLPFSPVPFTLQPLAVLIVGLVLGPLDGALALLAYLLEGAAGLPVFSPTGPGGLAQLLGPTGGYLLAYPLVAGGAGWLARALRPRLGAFAGALVACLLAVVLLFVCGAGWLAHLAPVGSHKLWVMAVAPFLPGEILKCFVAAGVFRSLAPPPAR